MDVSSKMREVAQQRAKNIASGFEKSDIYYAISDSNIRISKTGEEIKKQVNDTILPLLQSKVESLKTNMNEKLKECGNAPTHDCGYSDMEDLQCNYKTYSWDETCFCNKNSVYENTLSVQDLKDRKEKMNLPESEEQANCRREYNDIVYRIRDIMLDIRACKILQKLQDDKEYELSPRQVVALKFSTGD